MPLYPYICQCGYDEEEFRSYETKDYKVCPECACPMTINFGAMRPYVSPEKYVYDYKTNGLIRLKFDSDRELKRKKQTYLSDTEMGREEIKQAKEFTKERECQRR